MLEYCRYGNIHSFICVGVFSVEVTFLCYIMVNFDAWDLFFGHFCSPWKELIMGTKRAQKIGLYRH